MTRKNEPSFVVPEASDLDTKMQIFKVVARESGIIRAGLDLCKKISAHLHPETAPQAVPAQPDQTPMSVIFLESDGIRPGDEQVASSVEQTRIRTTSHHRDQTPARRRRMSGSRV